MDNVNEYGLNYIMVYTTKCKYVTIQVTSKVQAIMW